ncbi:MAG: histidine kinase famiy protein [Massilia sp.]
MRAAPALLNEDSAMVLGTDNDDGLHKPLDQQGGGQSAGVPAAGELEGNAYNPAGGPGIRHWQASYIDHAGLEDRGNVFFAAVEMTRMPMVVTDPNQHDNPIVFANNAFLDLTGYRQQDVIGRNCRFLQGPQTDRRTVDEVRAALAGQRAVAVDILNYKADSTQFWNALFIGPVFDQHGKLLHYFASQMDITERRMSQESNLQAQKMEAIGQLTAGLAHDFNNLLQVINGNLELAQHAIGAQHRAGASLERAQRAANKAATLTQQLLTFARKQRLEPKRVNLNTLVVEFSEMLVRTLGDNVELRLDLRPGLPSCTLDPTHLEMALLNVLINSRDAMPEGGQVMVTTSIMRDSECAASHQLPPGNYAVICIQDTGEGMTAEVARRATEPFFTTKGPGTGLGLAMVHGFVQQSQGRLELDSEPGHGTTVRMIFPIADPPPHEAGPAGPTVDEAAGGKPCILVVEDNDDVRELAQGVLALAGYGVRTAPSGEYALTLLEQDLAIDLLFTDVIMPGGMDGLQLVERARQLRPGMPALLTTGYMDELQSKAGRAEALDVLAKPYQHAELLERVRTALQRKS